ncbi:hydrogenase formation protein HypD, partial [Candidatus Aerophobetes bacterium]|nr:hydrogenase formation protein HypD [Candidatus Aerophobetes bacterium]
MKYLSDFRNQEVVKNLSGRMREIAEKIGREVKFMEVCGTHAMSVLRFGIKQLIPSGVHLLSGPGCPVCVTPSAYIDVACRYVRENFLVATFGDMMKVPGSFSSLLKEKSSGGKVKVVYSPVDALKLAFSLPQEKVVFLGIGFETTAPAVAASIVMAKEQKLSNFTVLCGHKLIPPAMKQLLESG